MNSEAWRVEFTRPAERDLKRLPSDQVKRLIGPIGALAFDQRPPGCEKVVGTNYWRIREGDARVVYYLDAEIRRVVVVRVVRRGENTYRRLRS